ncbi:MAG: class I SAM-dependent methyltransferase [Gammaproteobacteria bacterium]|nr:class I SAM-dependent methyltransferase [Gammaproteobacteria bacterium]
MDTKFHLQAAQYAFPYHWLPILDKKYGFTLGQSLAWGLDYLTYMDFISTLIVNQNPLSILDVGCGDGRLLSFICSKNKELKNIYTGIDLCEKAILFAKLLNDHETFFSNNVADMKGSFDAITLIEVLEHIPDEIISDFLTDVQNRLTPDGRLYISVPAINVPTNEKHYRHYSLQLLQETLQMNEFKIENTYFIHKISWSVSLIRRIVVNRIYTLNASAMTKLIWNLYQRIGYMAAENNCTHIVVEARINSKDRQV